MGAGPRPTLPELTREMQELRATGRDYLLVLRDRRARREARPPRWVPVHEVLSSWADADLEDVTAPPRARASRAAAGR